MLLILFYLNYIKYYNYKILIFLKLKKKMEIDI